MDIVPFAWLDIQLTPLYLPLAAAGPVSLITVLTADKRCDDGVDDNEF